MSTTRPKPWETGTSASGSDATASSSIPISGPSSAVPQTATNNDTTSAAAASGVPPVPARPTTLNSVAPTTSYTPGGYGGYSGMNSAYGSYGSYGSGYGMGSGMGGYGSYSGYGGMGGYGSMGGYGGYGSYGGYGGYGSYNRMGMGGMGNPNNPLETSTAATFQLIESIVGAFGGFAQMLESTYMATHTSFYAMMSVAEQFGHLKQSLGSILGIFALLRWSKALIAKVTGKQPPNQLTPANFAKFQASGGASGAARPSFKPLLMFLAAVVGLPYLLGKLIRSMASQQQAEMGLNGDGSIDPSKLDFCRALYDFVPENPQIELELKKGDLVAVLSATDPSGNPSQWWRVRTRDGRSGYVPATYVEIIPRQAPLEASPAAVATATPAAGSIKQIE